MIKKIFFFFIFFNLIYIDHSYSITIKKKETNYLEENIEFYCRSLIINNNSFKEKLILNNKTSDVDILFFNEKKYKNLDILFESQDIKQVYNTIEKKNYKYILFRIEKYLKKFNTQLDFKKYYKNIIFWDNKDAKLSFHFIINQKQFNYFVDNEIFVFKNLTNNELITTILNRDFEWFYSNKKYEYKKIIQPIEVVIHFPNINFFDKARLDKLIKKENDKFIFEKTIGFLNFNKDEEEIEKIGLSGNNFEFSLDYGHNEIKICNQENYINLNYLIKENLIKEQKYNKTIEKKNNLLEFILSLIFVVLLILRLFFLKKIKFSRNLLNYVLFAILIVLYLRIFL